MSKDDLLRKGLKVPHIPWFSVNGRVLRLRVITMFGWIDCLKPVLVLGKWLNGKKILALFHRTQFQFPETTLGSSKSEFY